jgi:hypothetical protein
MTATKRASLAWRVLSIDMVSEWRTNRQYQTAGAKQTASFCATVTVALTNRGSKRNIR